MDSQSHIFREIWQRLKKPWSIGFILYFFLVIILLGGLGVILPLLYGSQDLQNLSGNLITYSIALLAPAFITIFLQFLPKAQNKVSLVILSVFVLVLEGFIIHWAYSGALIASIFSTLLSLCVWIIASAEDKYLDDQAYNNNIKKGLEDHGKNWDNEDSQD